MAKAAKITVFAILYCRFVLSFHPKNVILAHFVCVCVCTYRACMGDKKIFHHVHEQQVRI